MEEDFTAVLTAASAVTSIVPVARINWGQHPQGAAYPALVLNLIDNAPGLTMQGTDGLWSGRVQVDCYAREFKQARDLATAVAAALHGHRGANLRLVVHAATRSTRESAASDADRLFRFGLDFLTHWRDT